MVIYWSIFAVSLFAFLFDSGSPRTIKLGDDKTARRSQFIWPFITLAMIAFFSGARSFIADTYAYQTSFINAPSEFSEIFDYVAKLEADRLFSLAMLLLKCTFPNATYTLWFMVVAIVSMVCFFSCVYKHAENASFVVFLFVLSSNFVWMLNGVRQFLAVCILMAGTSFLIEKKWLKYFLVVFVAFNIHDSSLLMIPFYFVIQSKPWSKRVWLFIGAALLAVVFAEPFMSTMDTVLEDTSLSDSISFALKDTSGSNIIRFFVAAVPVGIALMKRKEVEEKTTPFVDICINMSLITALSYLLASVTSGIIMGRIPIFFEIYSYILLDWLLRNVFKDDQKFLMQTLCILFYTAYFYYQMVIVYQGLGYYSEWLGIELAQ